MESPQNDGLLSVEAEQPILTFLIARNTFGLFVNFSMNLGFLKSDLKFSIPGAKKKLSPDVEKRAGYTASPMYDPLRRAATVNNNYVST